MSAYRNEKDARYYANRTKHLNMIEYSKHSIPEFELWRTCLFTGLRAAALVIERGHEVPDYYELEDLHFVHCDDVCPGSIRWICEYLGLDLDRIRRKFQTAEWRQRLISFGLNRNTDYMNSAKYRKNTFKVIEIKGEYVSERGDFRKHKRKKLPNSL